MKIRISLLDNHGKALLRIAQYKWLRPQELGLLQFGNDVFARKYSEAILRRLTTAGMLIARKLPAHTGTAFVLSQAGAALVSEWSDGTYSSGKDWGKFVEEGEEKVWYPPHAWEHDLLAVGLLAHLKTMGWRITPEIALRREIEASAPIRKRPDGLAKAPNGTSFWVEVEQAAKKGKDMALLAEALMFASRGKPVTCYDSWQDSPVTGALVAINRDSRDTRGYHVDHLHRITNAIVKATGERGWKNPVQLTVAWLEMRGAGVRGVKLEQIQVQPA